MRNSLRSLFISENQLNEITAPSPSDSPLQSVNTLFLDGNPLKHWSSIDAMVEWLPNIINLRVVDTPLTTGELSLHMKAEILVTSDPETAKYARQILIGRIACLRRLNSSEVRNFARVMELWADTFGQGN